MEIVYCNSCGFRIPEEEFEAARAARIDGVAYCAKCRPDEKPGKASHKRMSVNKPPQEAAASAPRPPPDSQRLHHHTAPASKKETSALVPVVVGVVVAVGVMFVMLVGPSDKDRAKPKEAEHASVARNDAPPVTPVAPVSPALPVTPERVAPPEDAPSPPAKPNPRPAEDSAETRALEAFDKVTRFDGLSADDKDGRAKRVQDFLKACPADTLAASRARALLEQLRNPVVVVPPPPTPPVAEVAAPNEVKAPAPVAGGTEGATVLLKDDFDGPTCHGLAFAELADNLPGGVPGKAMKLKGGATYVKGALAEWALPGNPIRHITFPAIEGARLRFRYYAGPTTKNMTAIIQPENGDVPYAKPVAPVVTEKWTQVELLLSEFTAGEGKGRVAPGTRCQLVLVEAYSNRDLVCYVDDLEVLGPAPAPVAALTPEATSVPVANAKILLQNDFEGPEALQNFSSGVLETKQTYGGSRGALKCVRKTNTFFYSEAFWEVDRAKPFFVISDTTVFSCAYYVTTSEQVVFQMFVGRDNNWENVAWVITDPKPNQWNVVSRRMVEVFKTAAGLGALIQPGSKVPSLQFFAGTPDRPTELYVDKLVVSEPLPAAAPPPVREPAQIKGAPYVRFLLADDKRGGAWKKDLGRDGYVIFNKKGLGEHDQRLPDYIQEVLSTGQHHIWQQNGDARGLENPEGGGTFAGCEFTTDAMTVRITAKRVTPARLSLYIMDFDSAGRKQRLEMIVDGKVQYTQELEKLTAGLWLHFEVAGSVDIRIVWLGLSSSIINGLFWDPAPPAADANLSAYQVFQEEFLDLLRHRDAAGGAARLAAAEKHLALKSNLAELTQDRKALVWLNDLDAIALKGLGKLKDADDFELRPLKGEAMRVGTRGAYKFADVKQDTVVLDTHGMRVPVTLDSLQRETRDRLALLGCEDDAAGLLRRAFLQLLLADGGPSGITPAAVRTTLARAQAAGAPAEEQAVIQRVLDVQAQHLRQLEAQENAAAANWKEISKLVDGAQWRQLPLACATFKARYESTRFAAKRTEEIKALLARGETMLGLEKGLAGCWKFDEGAGTAAFDSSGNGNNGTLSAGVTWVAGKVGKAVAFDAKDSHVALANSPTLENVQEGDYTLTAWVRPNSVPPGKGDANNAAYGIIIKPGCHIGLNYRGKFSLLHYLSGDTMLTAESSHIYAAGAWYFVAGTVSKSEGAMKLYVNGAPEATIAFAAGKDAKEYDAATWKIGIGGPGQKNWRWAADAAIDEVRIYNRCLSETEVRALAGVPLKPAP